MTHTLQNIQTQISLLDTKSRAYRRVQLEGGEGYNPFDAQIDKLADQYAALVQKMKDKDHDAEWTLEITQSRRREWNHFIRAISTPKGIPSLLVKNRQEKQGWVTNDLRAAIIHHQL